MVSVTRPTCRASRGRMLIMMLAMLWSLGCGQQPTIDGSSTRRYFESKEEVRSSLSADERGRFDNAVALIESSWAIGTVVEGLSNLGQDAVDGLSGKPRRRAERQSPIQTLHGLTARQVIAMADSMGSVGAKRRE
jgi:hypothetical protein